MRQLGIACDHAGFDLKTVIAGHLQTAGYEVRDFGAHELSPEDDYPSYVVPLARALAAGDVERGIAVCGSGAGACIAANKVRGVRAALIHESFTARQGVEDDDMNLICLGGRVLGTAMAWELVQAFLAARFSGAERHVRRLAMVRDLEETEKYR